MSIILGDTFIAIIILEAKRIIIIIKEIVIIKIAIMIIMTLIITIIIVIIIICQIIGQGIGDAITIINKIPYYIN